MVLEINKNKGPFKIKQVWFADFPYDIKKCDRAIFLDCKRKFGSFGFECKEHTTFVIDLNKDLEEIWNKMSSTCRYEIRRAERDGIKIERNQNFEDFIKMEKLFNKTKKLIKRGNLSLNFIKKYGTLFVAKFGGEIIGGQFYLEDKENIRLLSAPSRRLNVDSKKSSLIGMGNRLITWKAINYAKEEGKKEFDFGGYYSGGKGAEILDTANLFKQSFGGEVRVRFVCQKDYSKVYKFLSSFKQKIIN